MLAQALAAEVNPIAEVAFERVAIGAFQGNAVIPERFLGVAHYLHPIAIQYFMLVCFSILPKSIRP